jgi:hypothetical protein
MNSGVSDPILSRYLEAYRNLLDVQEVDSNSVTISFPFHYSGNHRIEVTVTKISERSYVISDMARTLSELRNFGYRVQTPLHKRIEKLSKLSGLRIVQDYLLLESDADNLGQNIQKFLEAAKTVADVYLVHRTSGLKEDELSNAVREVLNRRRVIYEEKDKAKLVGEIETHKMNFLIAPNGKRGMAIAILPAYNSHLVAEAWGFKCEDIRRVPANLRFQIGLVYDTSQPWTDESRHILNSKADMAIPGDSLHSLDRQLLEQGIAKQ